MDKCVFCDSDVKTFSAQGASNIYGCPCCGFWQVSYSYANNLNASMRSTFYDKKHLIAGYLYEYNRSKTEPYTVTHEGLTAILDDGRIPRTPMQRMERFLLNLYKADDTIGKVYRATRGIVLPPSDREVNLCSLAYAKNETELVGMFNSLTELGYMSKTQHTNDMADYFITPNGFQRAEQLLSTNINSNSVFVAMAFRSDLLGRVLKLRKYMLFQ